jgi:hypothetical protein
MLPAGSLKDIEKEKYYAKNWLYAVINPILGPVERLCAHIADRCDWNDYGNP